MKEYIISGDLPIPALAQRLISDDEIDRIVADTQKYSRELEEEFKLRVNPDPRFLSIQLD